MFVSPKLFESTLLNEYVIFVGFCMISKWVEHFGSDGIFDHLLAIFYICLYGIVKYHLGAPGVAMGTPRGSRGYAQG